MTDDKAKGADLASKKAAQDAKGAHDADMAKDKATTKEATDAFAAMQGEFLNAADALGSSHEIRMAKSHFHQAMEWVHRHLHPDPSAAMPVAPPPAPPIAE